MNQYIDRLLNLFYKYFFKLIIILLKIFFVLLALPYVIFCEVNDYFWLWTYPRLKMLKFHLFLQIWFSSFRWIILKYRRVKFYIGYAYWSTVYFLIEVLLRKSINWLIKAGQRFFLRHLVLWEFIVYPIGVHIYLLGKFFYLLPEGLRVERKRLWVWTLHTVYGIYQRRYKWGPVVIEYRNFFTKIFLLCIFFTLFTDPVTFLNNYDPLFRKGGLHRFIYTYFYIYANCENIMFINLLQIKYLVLDCTLPHGGTMLDFDFPFYYYKMREHYSFFTTCFFFEVIVPTVHLIYDSCSFSYIHELFSVNPLFFYFAGFFFFGVLFSWFFFSYLGLYGVFILNLITLFFFWVSLCLSFESILLNQTVYIIKVCSWVFLGTNNKIDYYFLIDSISFSFIFLTTTIALFVLIYAFSYFRYEPLVDRFLLFLVSFVVSMLFLVSSGNIIMLFLGWELIGFTSFCLINFWTTKVGTLKSAFKAFTFNKVSDFFMFIFLLSAYSVFYTFDILAINNQGFLQSNMYLTFFNIRINFIEFLCFCLLGAAFIKSAQFGGHVWLPDSMEAPVPASSLIHSATLVSAGIYLILRFNPLFDISFFAKFLVPIIGSFTAAYGGVCAVAQSDIKKTLAYSTISHCGFLMVLCSTEMNEFTVLYLYIHGFFKAGVFMCVGNVLRITRGYQDTRRMGGLLKYLPFEYFMIVIGLFNLAGLPFTFGFFIKHLLLVSLEKYMYIYYFVLFNCLVGAFAGLFYSYRLLSYTFNDFKKAPKTVYLTLNNLNSNSFYFTATSKASTIAISSLFIVSYIVSYYLFKYLVFSNCQLNDYLNTTILLSYYTIHNVFSGYLLNFSYINFTVVFIVSYFVFSRFRKVEKYENILILLVYFIITVLCTYLFIY